MNIPAFKTRTLMRNFVTLANACIEAKVFKQSKVKQGDHWLPEIVSNTSTLSLPGKRAVSNPKAIKQGLAYNINGSHLNPLKPVLVLYK